MNSDARKNFLTLSNADNFASEADKANNLFLQQELFQSANKQTIVDIWYVNGLQTVYSLALRLKDDLRPIIMYGAGTLAITGIRVLERCTLKPMLICDSNPEKQGSIVCGLNVISPDELIKNHINDYIFISTKDYYYSVYNQLIKMGFNPENIFSMLAV